MRTQWNMGMNGATGLNYTSLTMWLRMEKVPYKDWPETTTSLQIMEQETLRIWAEQR